MHEQLATVIADLDAASTRLKTLGTRLSPSAWHRRPAPDRWSPGECIAHLNLTSDAFIPLLRAGIEEARSKGPVRAAHFKLGFTGWLVRTVAGPSRWLKTKTTPGFVPMADRPGTELVARFERLQDEIVGLARASDGLPLDQVAITSPFNAHLRYSVYAAFSTIPGHQLRHLAQAEEAANGR